MHTAAIVEVECFSSRFFPLFTATTIPISSYVFRRPAKGKSIVNLLLVVDRSCAPFALLQNKPNTHSHSHAIQLFAIVVLVAPTPLQRSTFY